MAKMPQYCLRLAVLKVFFYLKYLQKTTDEGCLPARPSLYSKGTEKTNQDLVVFERSYTMKKLLTLAVGLGLVFTVAGTASAISTPSD